MASGVNTGYTLVSNTWSMCARSAWSSRSNVTRSIP